jgi:hypothetical protein
MSNNKLSKLKAKLQNSAHQINLYLIYIFIDCRISSYESIINEISPNFIRITYLKYRIITQYYFR